MVIRSPLVLVSQIQRSGGSLLSQLFDGHPELYAHPFEIRISYPRLSDWPSLDLDADPAVWFALLRDDKWAKLAERGFSKRGRNPHATERYSFTFSEDEQRALFLELVRSRPIRRQRDILDCFFTSFFRAWKDWRPTGREVAVTGFTPRVVMLADSLARFRDDYPDGKLITIVRDPRSWYASSSRTNRDHADVSFAVAEWLQSTRACAQFVRDREPSVLGLVFEDLVSQPEAVMRRVAEFIGIEFDPCLLEPSYLGRPLRPNSSFAVAEYGINPLVLRREAEISAAARTYIEAEALPVYEELTGLLAEAAPSR